MQVRASPVKATLLVTEVTPATGLAGFVGESEKVVTSHVVPCYFEFNLNSKTREKYGLSVDVNDTVFFAPYHIKRIFGSYKLPEKRVTVLHIDRLFIIDTARYLEEMYGSCVAIQLGLKTAVKGGN